MKHPFRSLLSLTLATACGLQIAAAASPEIAVPWAADAAAACVQRGLLPNESTPSDAPITGTEFLTLLARLDDSSEAPLVWADRLGLTVSGWSTAQALSRQDAAVLMDAYLAQRAVILPASAAQPFSDLGATRPSTQEAITRLQQAGLFAGNEANAFQPEASLTRAETAVLLDHAWDVLTAVDRSIETISSFDGYALTGKLNVPRREQIDTLVVFVNGSGPNTYDNTRQFGTEPVNYFDLFAEYCAREGAAFFSSSTRGVSAGTQPPLFCEIDDAAYQTYQPEAVVQDTEAIVRHLRKDARFQNAKIYLLGWSEGTMIAPKVAARGKVQVDGLLLAGYVNGTMAESLEWQQTGGSSMVVYCQYFDTDGDGRISEAEYKADPYQVRTALGLSEISFSELDLDENGYLERADFAAMLQPSRAALYDAIDRGDDAWLAANYGVRLTSAWFRAHEAFQPNRDMLPSLTLPIFIFQGECDANVSVQDARDAAAAFKAAGKTNLTLYTFPDADHDLNVSAYFYGAPLPDGFRALFRTIGGK